MRGGRRLIRSARPLVIFEYHEGTRTHFSLDDVRTEPGEDYDLFRFRSDGFPDNDLRLTWNCVAGSRASHIYTIAKHLTMGASRVSFLRNAAPSTAEEIAGEARDSH